MEFNDKLIVFLFYALIILLIYFNRRRFEFQGKLIALLRTNTGLKWMESVGKKYKKIIIAVASVGVVVSWICMLLIVIYLIYGIYTTFFVPGSPPVVSPILPGVKIPGSEFHLPLIEGLIALFVSILVHEASHGIVASAYGMKIKSSGLFLLGPIPGAFVEPDEKKLQKSKPWTQLSVYSAGPWSNILLSVLVILLATGLSSIIVANTDSNGVLIQGIEPGSPAELSGLSAGEIIKFVDDKPTNDLNDLFNSLSDKKPGDRVKLVTDKAEYDFVLGSHSVNEVACMGVQGLVVQPGENDITKTKPFLSKIMFLLIKILMWIGIISSGLGFANLMPLGPVDGGRMLQIGLRKFLPEQRADYLWSKIAILLIGLLLILLFVPILKALITEPVVAHCLPV